MLVGRCRALRPNRGARRVAAAGRHGRVPSLVGRIDHASRAQVERCEVVVHCASATDGMLPALNAVPFQLGAKRSSSAVVPAAFIVN